MTFQRINSTHLVTEMEYEIDQAKGMEEMETKIYLLTNLGFTIVIVGIIRSTNRLNELQLGRLQIIKKYNNRRNQRWESKFNKSLSKDSQRLTGKDAENAINNAIKTHML